MATPVLATRAATMVVVTSTEASHGPSFSSTALAAASLNCRLGWGSIDGRRWPLSKLLR